MDIVFHITYFDVTQEHDKEDLEPSQSLLTFCHIRPASQLLAYKYVPNAHPYIIKGNMIHNMYTTPSHINNSLTQVHMQKGKQ